MYRYLILSFIVGASLANAEVDLENFELVKAKWSVSWDGKRAFLKSGAIGCILPQYRDEIQKLLLAEEVEAANEAFGNVCLANPEDKMVIILGETDPEKMFSKKLVVIEGQRVWVYTVSLICCYTFK